MMKDQFESYPVETAMILGVAGGNGLEHIDPAKYKRVYGVDINEEVSLVCRTEDVPENTTDREDGWRVMRFEGVLDFSLVGILSKVSNVLAEEKISIFVTSTYNTDYVLVKGNDLERAVKALEGAGYEVE